MRKLLAISTTTVALMLAVIPLLAHHSFVAEFDDKQPVKLTGKITKMEWVNPHAWIHIDVTNPDGSVTPWMVEANTPNGLLRRGFTKKSLEAGTEIMIQGYRARSGENKANGSSATFKDGKRLFLGSSRDGEEGGDNQKK
jgi:hypothetical protein